LVAAGWFAQIPTRFDFFTVGTVSLRGSTSSASSRTRPAGRAHLHMVDRAEPGPMDDVPTGADLVARIVAEVEEINSERPAEMAVGQA
jgi:hypothetical protein